MANIFVAFSASNCTRPSGPVSCQQRIDIAARWAAKRLGFYDSTKILARWAMEYNLGYLSKRAKLVLIKFL